MRHNIICGTNYKYRTGATLHTQETWFVSGKYPHKGDKYNNNNNNSKYILHAT